MKYPIDVEAFIADIREHFVNREDVVDFCRSSYIPAMNAAYQDGKNGASGYPMHPAAWIADCETGGAPLSDLSKCLIAAFVRGLNAAYAQGREDVTRATA